MAISMPLFVPRGITDAFIFLPFDTLAANPVPLSVRIEKHFLIRGNRKAASATGNASLGPGAPAPQPEIRAN
jgi:hypothetical protein